MLYRVSFSGDTTKRVMLILARSLTVAAQQELITHLSPITYHLSSL